MMQNLEITLSKLIQDYAGGNFIPILEADIVGYLYHLWISQFGKANDIHLDTRICGSNKRFDFVIGNVNYRSKRPCVKRPSLVIEVKAFPFGFTDQEHRKHYFHVMKDDIPKLASLKDPEIGRFALLFDEDNYLEGFDKASNTMRLKRILNVRSEHDPRIKIIHIRKMGKNLEYRFF